MGTYTTGNENPKQRAIPAALDVLKMLGRVVSVKRLALCMRAAGECLRDGENGIGYTNAFRVAPPRVANKSWLATFAVLVRYGQV